MKEYMEHLQARLAQHSPDLGDCESVLGLLYEPTAISTPCPIRRRSRRNSTGSTSK